MDEIKSQEAGEEARLRRALFTLLQKCPLIPDTVSVKYGEAAENAVGIFSQKGDKRITKQFVSGAYEAQFPFLLRYMTVPSTDDDRIGAEELLAGIADWLCGAQVYPVLSENRQIVKIEAGNVYSEKKQEDGTISYEVTMNMKYTKGR